MAVGFLGAIGLLGFICLLCAAGTIGADVRAWFGFLRHFPFAELLDPLWLPTALVAGACGWALLAAPLWSAKDAPAFGEAGERTWILKRIIVAVTGQALILIFFLTLASRLTPLAPPLAADAVCVVAAAAFAAGCLAARRSLWHSGIIVLWAVIPPLCCFLAIEVFLAGPGNGNFWTNTADAGTSPPPLVSTVETTLALSPFSAAVTAVNGEFPGERPRTWLSTLLFLGICAVFSLSAFFPKRVHFKLFKPRMASSSSGTDFRMRS
jgi:hypothetical protein